MRPLYDKLAQQQRANAHLAQVIKLKQATKTRAAATKHITPKATLTIQHILTTLEVTANKTQAIIQSIGPYTRKSGQCWGSYQVKFTLAGQYQAILNFINLMAQQYNWLTYDELSLQQITTSPLLDEFTLSIIITIPDHSTSSVAAKDQLIMPAVHHPRANNNLSLWARSELQFLGSIDQAGKTIGFVADPLGQTHQVAIGDKIGLKQEPITNIDHHGVTTNAL